MSRTVKQEAQNMWPRHVFCLCRSTPRSLMGPPWLNPFFLPDCDGYGIASVYHWYHCQNDRNLHPWLEFIVSSWTDHIPNNSLHLKLASVLVMLRRSILPSLGHESRLFLFANYYWMAQTTSTYEVLRTCIHFYSYLQNRRHFENFRCTHDK